MRPLTKGKQRQPGAEIDASAQKLENTCTNVDLDVEV
jgi:hypothetical protein